MKNLKTRAADLRRRGWSYNIIAKRLGVSKSSLSDWLREVPYSPNQAVIDRIRAGPARAATTKQETRLHEILTLKAEARNRIGHVSRRDLWFLGMGLYLVEGSKLYETVRLINSDPNIIKLAMRWFRETCQIPDRHFAVAVHLYPDTTVDAALAYWSKVTGLPRAQFEKVQIDRRLGKSARKQRRLPYGTAHIKIRSRGDRRFGVTLHRRIMGWIEAVCDTVRV